MPNIGNAYVQIVPSAQGIKGSVESVLSPEATRAGLSAGAKINKAIGSKLQSVGKGMIKAGAIASGLAVPIIAGIKKSMDAYKVQSAAETKLTEIYKTRMGVSDKAAKKTMELASALQKQGIIGDEVALSGSQQLATFAKYPSTINTLMPAMENLLAQQKGVNATAEDAVNVGNLMGKVMMGQTGALRRVGVTFTEAQEKVLKYGTEEEKAAMLAKVITDNVGNMNKAMLQTPEGKIQQMKNAMGDLAEKLGAALAPTLASVANFLSANVIPKVEGLLTFMQGHPIIAKIVIGITGLLAVGGPLLVMLGTLITSVGAIMPLLSAITAPIAGAIAGVIGATTAIGLLYAKSETFRNMIQQVAEVLKGAAINAFNQLKPAVSRLGSAILQLWKTIAPYLIPALKKIASVVPSVVSAFARLLSVAIRPIRTALRLATTAVKLMTSALKTALSTGRTVASGLASAVKTIKDAFAKVYHAVMDPFKKAYDKVKDIISKIKGLFPFSVGKIFSGWIPKIKLWTSKSKDTANTNSSVGRENFAKAMGQPYVFKRPTEFYAGEAGDEMLYGRRSLMSDIRDAVGADKGRSVNNVWNINVNGSEDPEQFASRLVGRLKMEMRTV